MRGVMLALAWGVGCSAPIPYPAPRTDSKAPAPQDAAVYFAEEMVTSPAIVAPCVGYYGRSLRVRVLASGEITGVCQP